MTLNESPVDCGLIKSINRIFHDEEAAFFSDRHDERIRRESVFYGSFFNDFMRDRSSNARILDIGTGRGLVPESCPDIVARFVCADISVDMLRRARNDTLGRKPIWYVSCDAERLPFADKAFDLVVCNAAMHHFPSVEKFARESARVVGRGGMIVIGFEANKRFWNNRALLLLYRVLDKIVSFRAAKKSGYAQICDRVNERLMREGIIREPLSVPAMMERVDIHSPNAGDRICGEKGFVPQALARDLFPGFTPEIVYHYDAGPSMFNFINRMACPGCAPRFSLILKRDND